MSKKRGLSIEGHVENARRVLRIREDLGHLQQDVWGCYPKSSRLNASAEAATRAVERLRSELEEALYRDHPDASRRAGFPHYDTAALARLAAEVSPGAEL